MSYLPTTSICKNANIFSFLRNRSGLPDGAEHKHCKIYVAGPAKCKRSGNRMWRDYQDIRKHGCESCGSKHWGDHDHCRTTVNYVG